MEIIFIVMVVLIFQLQAILIEVRKKKELEIVNIANKMDPVNFLLIYKLTKKKKNIDYVKHLQFIFIFILKYH